MGERLGTLAKIKVHPGKCRGCRMVYLPDVQASKVNAQGGWYDSMVEARQAIERDSRFDPAVKSCGHAKCPDCPN